MLPKDSSRAALNRSTNVRKQLNVSLPTSKIARSPKIDQDPMQMSFDSPKNLNLGNMRSRVSNLENIPVKLGQYVQTSSIHQDDGSPRSPMSPQTKITRQELQFHGQHDRVQEKLIVQKKFQGLFDKAFEVINHQALTQHVLASPLISVKARHKIQNQQIFNRHHLKSPKNSLPVKGAHMIQRDLDKTFGIRLSNINDSVHERSRQFSNLRNNSINQRSIHEEKSVTSPTNSIRPFSNTHMKTTMNGFKKIKASCLLTSGEIVAQVVQRQDSGKISQNKKQRSRQVRDPHFQNMNRTVIPSPVANDWQQHRGTHQPQRKLISQQHQLKPQQKIKEYINEYDTQKIWNNDKYYTVTDIFSSRKDSLGTPSSKSPKNDQHTRKAVVLSKQKQQNNNLQLYAPWNEKQLIGGIQGEFNNRMHKQEVELQRMQNQYESDEEYLSSQSGGGGK
ncbi:hypothetical protein FGO68_gene1265 [Halteria grandinella]|uniref:Uncharacterized protein n=1 Tax=Halteria grandinella TaxID=5974 RepID=A0A8J8SWW8_HALGN|nr:hypothetical protein FGO68_gene1265 [Halteria grandinella]